MTDRGQRKGSSNNINININLLSMKDGLKPIGKKIQNNIRIGSSGMEAKRMTLLTQRLQEKKRQIETYHDPDESEYMKSKMNGYTTKKQRSKTNKNNQDQMVTAFSTTNARGKFNSRDIKDIKDTPNKAFKTRQEDFSTKTKKNLSGQKMKSRRDSRGSHSTGNLHKIKVYKSPNKSETNSNPRSKSNKKRQRIISKNKEKMSLDVNNKPSIRQTINSNHDTIKSGKLKPQTHKGKDDTFIKKKPVQVKKPTKIKSPFTSMIDEPVKFPLSKNKSRKASFNRLPKYSDKKQQSPDQKKKNPTVPNKQTKNKAATYIQKMWRGYWQRKNLKNILQSLLNRNKKIKSLISANKKQFWKDVSQDSIKYVDVQIQDSFAQQSIHSDLKNPLQLFSGQQVQSVQGQFDELNPFDKLIKMSQQVGDYKLARQLRNMAQNLIKQQIQKKQIIRQNKQLKQDIIQLKQQSIHNAIPIPLILPERKYSNQFIQPNIIMPVKRIQKIQQIEIVQKKQKIQIKDNNQIKQYKQTISKIVKIQNQQKQIQIVKKVEEPKSKIQEFYSAKQHEKQIDQQDPIQKRRLIQQLKSFKGQSDSLMKKIEKNKQPEKKKQQPKFDFQKSANQNKKLSEKGVPIFERHQFDYQQMNNESGDSEQFKQAIRKSQQDNYNKQSNELFNKQSQKQIKGRQITNKLPQGFPEITNQFQNLQLNNSDLEDSQRSQINPIAAQKKGFQTNLNFVKQYCIGLCQFVRNSEQIKSEFKRKVIKPMSINILQLLKSYRQTIEGQQNNEFNSFKYDYVYPYYRDTVPLEYLITEKTFEQFNATLPNLKRNSDGQQNKTDIELQAIHLKSLLDVFNESLNYERPSSIHGQPLPWAPKVKHLKNISNTFEQNDVLDNEYSKQNEKFDQLFGVSIARVIQWGSSLCGFIPESLDMDSNIQIDQQYINHIKQTRMALMLEKTLAQDQQKMLQFVDVETEVKLQISSKIMQDLLEQVFQQIQQQYLN